MKRFLTISLTTCIAALAANAANAQLPSITTAAARSRRPRICRARSPSPTEPAPQSIAPWVWLIPGSNNPIVEARGGFGHR